MEKFQFFCNFKKTDFEKKLIKIFKNNKFSRKKQGLEKLWNSPPFVEIMKKSAKSRNFEIPKKSAKKQLVIKTRKKTGNIRTWNKMENVNNSNVWWKYDLKTAKFKRKFKFQEFVKFNKFCWKWRTLKFAQNTLNILQTLQFENQIEKLPIEGKFNKIKIILKKLKTQQNFEKNQISKKVQIWCKIEIQQILKKIQTKFKNTKSLEKILKISNFHKIVKIQQNLMKY